MKTPNTLRVNDRILFCPNFKETISKFIMLPKIVS